MKLSPKRPGEDHPVREQFAWTYGHLAMAHMAVGKQAKKYHPGHYAVRTRFRRGYLDGTMTIETLYADERTKIAYGTTCCYCGGEEALTLDHVIPRLKGGADAADNIMYACKSCNSSKGAQDMVTWLTRTGRFPAILVFRRYLKLAARWCENAKMMDTPWMDVAGENLPFDQQSLRVKWPPPSELWLWPPPAVDRCSGLRG